MRALALLLLLALTPSLARAEAPDAGTDKPLFILPVKEGGLISTEGQLYEVDGGVYLDNDALFVVSRELVLLRAENKSLKETPVVVSSTPTGILIALTVGLLLGGGGAAYLFLRK